MTWANVAMTRRWRDVPVDKKLAIVVPAAVALVAVWLQASLNDVDAPGEGAEHGVLEVVDVSVIEGVDTELILEDPFDGTVEKSETDAAGLDVVVRNATRDVSVVHRAEFHILRSRQFCAAEGGALSMTAIYDVELPRAHVVGKRIVVDVRQEIAPNSADRFFFTMGMHARDVAHLGPPRAFQLAVTLFHDREDRPLEAGNVVVLVPFPDPIYLGDEGCAADNVHIIKRFAAVAGARSAELEELEREIVE